MATYRDTDLGRRHPLLELLANIPRLDEAERLPLTGLDVPGVMALMEQAAAHRLDEEGVALAHAVWRETEGNAFFVVEVLRHLTEAGAITQQEGQWRCRRPRRAGDSCRGESGRGTAHLPSF